MKASTTKLSLDYLREHGYTAEVVEHWTSSPTGRVRRDLFGILDIVALRGDETLGVQTTTKGQLSTRLRKIADSPHLPALREAGWSLVVHGWHQPRGKGTRYEVQEIDVS